MKNTKKRGFTLIELLVVVLIIGILAAIALPKYEVAVGRARVARALPVLRSLQQAQERHYLATGEYTMDLDSLDISLPYESSTDEGNRIAYTGSPIGTFRLGKGGAVFWRGPDLIIDVYRDQNRWRCYPVQTAAGKTGEKVCATFGAKTGSTSSLGTPTYYVQF